MGSPYQNIGAGLRSPLDRRLYVHVSGQLDDHRQNTFCSNRQRRTVADTQQSGDIDASGHL